MCTKVTCFVMISSSDLIYLDYALERIYEDLNQPDLFLLDVAPLFKVLIIASPMIAEQVSRPSLQYPYGLPKSWTMQDFLPLVGKQSIIISEVWIEVF